MHPLCPSPSVRRFPLDGGLLLLDRQSNCLFAYNDTARHAWELIEAGRPEPELVAEFAETWGIPPAVARADTAAIIAEWRSQNVLIERDAPPRPADAARTARAAPAMWLDPPAGGWWAEWICTIRGVPIAFAVDSELPGTVRVLFAHLETPAAVPQVRLEIRTGPNGERILVEDGRQRLCTIDPAEVIGALFVAVLERTRANLEWFAVIHGAALGRDGRGIALAGPSGSGKSTLAAGLIGAGYDFLADDMIALTEPEGAIVPWPLPLSIKQGSIEVVAAHHPQVAQAASYRTKGVDARMLLPRPEAWEADPVPLRCLVYPRFSAGAPPRAVRLTPFETIERLLTDRVWLGSPVTEQRMLAFLAWLDRTPSYALSYGSLDDGMRLVAELMA